MPESINHHPHHPLAKRQQSQCSLFLSEPPRLLRCNPQPDSTLTLRCIFLLGNTGGVTGTLPVTLGWFYSSDNIVGDLVQTDAFANGQSFSLFESTLVVVNARAGAYFCSVGAYRQVFDSRALRVDAATLQDVCLPREVPTLPQPPLPRCAQNPRIFVNPEMLTVRNRVAVTNTIDLRQGVVTPTPTYTAILERTIPPPVIETPLAVTMTTPPVTTTPLMVMATPLMVTATPQVTEAQQNQDQNQANAVGIGVGVAVGVVILGALVIGVAVGVACFAKRNDQRIQEKRRWTLSDMFVRRMQHHGGGPNTEPLLNPPPDRPPPVLGAIAATAATAADNAAAPEGIKVAAFTEPPQPYETAERRPKPDRYSREPGRDLPEETQEGYYSRLKFPKQGEDLRSFSTSTHTYTEKRDSCAYISPSNLEPFFPTLPVTEKELMLHDETEKSAEFYASSQFLSDEEESLSGEGSLTEDGEGEENVVESSNVDIQRISAWLDQNDKSPATGQLQVNGSSQEVEGGDEEEREYVNVVHSPGSRAAAKQESTKSSASSKVKKKKKKKQRSGKLRQDELYMDLVKETGDYTSVYTSTMPRSSSPHTNT